MVVIGRGAGGVHYLWNSEMLVRGHSRSIRRMLCRRARRPVGYSQRSCSRRTSSSQHHLPPVESSSSLRRPSLSPLELAYLVTNVELLDIVSLLHNLADKLVAADKVGRALQVSTVEMQVAAAEGCRRDFEDRIGGLLDVWVGAVFDGDLEE